nr:reverse transcriptase domain-containing protein [Tanacetum cinerariifolium]
LTLRHRDTINVAAGGTFMKRRPEECYDLIENMTAHHNDWDTSAQRSESSSSITSSSDIEIAALKAEMAKINKNLMRVLQVNDAILKNMQTNMTSLTNSNLELKNMFGQFMEMNTALSSGSGTLPGNTITNPKEDLKGITTRRGTAYPGPTIPTTSFSPVLEHETEATKDTVHPTNNESTKDVQPSVVPIESIILNSKPVTSPIIKPVASPFSLSIKTLLTNKDKLCELAKTELNEHYSAVLLKKLPKKLGDPSKFLISCDFPGMAECLALAVLGARINLMPLSVWNKISLPDLSPTCMTLELADRSISHPIRVDEDVFVKVGTFYFSADFVVIDFDVDPRAITFNLDQTSRYSANYNDMTANLNDVIDMACEEYSQEVLGFSDVITNGNPTPYYDPIVSTTSPTLTPFKNTFMNDDPSLPLLNQGNYLPEVRKELKICEAKSDKSSIDEPLEVELEDLTPHLEYTFLEGDDKLPVIITKDLSDDKLPVIITKDLSMEEKTALITEKTTFTCPYRTFAYRRMPFGLCNAPGTFQRCMMAIFHDMIEKTMEVFMDDFSVFENSFQSCLSHLENMLKRCEDTNLCLNWEKSHFMVKEGIVLGHKISKEDVEVDKAKVYVITKLPHPTTVKGIRSFLGHAGFYQRFIKDFLKIARPMTRLLEKDTPLIFSKECVEAFQTLKRKLTEAPILIALDWDMPFELMCDASDFAIGVVLGQRQEKHFRPIHYAKFTFKVIDTKGAENLATDLLSRLENLHQNVLDPKEINESFPFETLNLVSTRGNSSTPWFADFANYHAWNFVVKGMSSQQKRNKYILVAVEYLSKWVKAKAFLTNDARVVCKFLKNLFARFGTSQAIISDRGTHFCNDQFAKVMLKFGITHRLATPYHPQTSGQVEVSNRGLKRILERTVGENHASWSDKLDDALWAFRTTYKTPIGCTLYKLVYGKACHLLIKLEHKAYWALKYVNFDLQTAGENHASWLDKLDDALWAFRTTYKTPIGCTPYKLVYGKVCHLSIELEHKAYWALKYVNFDLQTAGDHIKVQLNELNKLRDQAYENSLIYKEKTKRLHDSKIKDLVFNIDNRVLLFNSRLKIFSGKLKSRCSGPFTISHVFPYGTVELS